MTTQSDRLISRPVFYSILGAIVVGGLFYALRGVLAPILLAFLLAYAFNPLAEFLTRHRIPRSLACALCLMILLMVTTGLFALIIPAIHHEIGAVWGKLPGYVEKIQTSTIPWLEETLSVDIPSSLDEALTSARAQFTGSAAEISGPVADFIKNVFSGAMSLLTSLIYVVLIPLFTFFFLSDYTKIISWFKDLIPTRQRESILGIFKDIDSVLSGFLRGQLTVCSILAVIYAIALPIAGVSAGVTIGVITGLFNMVPYLGTATGLLLSCLFLLLEGAGWTVFLAIGCIFVGVNTIDGLFLTPRILGKKLGLAPVAVILAIIVFSELFGFLGVLMAVPVTAIGKVLGKRALEKYRQSRAYRGTEEDEAAVPDKKPLDEKLQDDEET